MKISNVFIKTLKASASLLAISFASHGLAKNYIYTADERVVPIKGGFTQPDLSMYRSKIESKIIDRTFYTNEATFMANEGFKTGMEGYNDMVKAGFPIAYKRAFQWVTAREMYFYARYLLDYVGGRGHAGVHMVHGPYWSMKADQHSQFNRITRDRGERNFSNKDVLLGIHLPLVYQRTGFPRVFDDIQPTYLQYRSIQPFFEGKLDNTDSFYDAMSGKKGGWGVPNTYFNNVPQRFNHDDMDTTFDLGAMGQFVKRRSQWLDRFYQADHKGTTHGSGGVEVNLIGNDAEEGMRGWGLTTSAFNEILQVKASMFTDGKKLMGLNTDSYNPANGLRYLPHEVKPNLLWVGDIPERVWSMEIQNAESHLWDQASWVWATSSYAVAANRRNNFFTDNPPVDGGLMEKRTGLVAESLGKAVFKNIQAMHLDKGILVSKWKPKTGMGSSVELKDLAMAMVAIHDMSEAWEGLGRHSDLVQQAKTIVKTNGDFLLHVQNSDGSFSSAYSTSGQKQGQENIADSQWEAIRGLLTAYYSTKNDAYVKAARAAYEHMNQNYWVADKGIYRSELNNDSVSVKPYSVGITMAALRELMFTTPTYLLEPQIEQMTRWWVQTVNQSGLLLSEHQSTGEVLTGFGESSDDDGDGIPYVSKAHGKNGAAPLMAAEVVINLGGESNAHFKKLKGDLHSGGNVLNRFNYKDHPSLVKPVSLPLKNPAEDGLVNRNVMTRIDGTRIPLQPTKPITVGLGTSKNLTGKQIFDANCLLCHGENGEGIDGKPLKTFMNLPAIAMEVFVRGGNPAASMPAFGIGNNDEGGSTLTNDEIARVVSYVQSDEFKSNYSRAEKGEVIPGSIPKDIWFYLSRENLKNKGKTIIGSSTAKQYIEKMKDPKSIRAQAHENIRRTQPDANTQL